MKKTIILLTAVILSMTSFAQYDDEEPLLISEQMPRYQQGEKALRSTIAKNIEYPSEAVEKGIEGIVYTRFVVTETGDVGKIEVQRGVHPLLDAEAVRVLKTLGKFTPGMQKGKPVAVWMSLPISFQLSQYDKGKQSSAESTHKGKQSSNDTKTHKGKRQ